jgi:hypothetical protein
MVSKPRRWKLYPGRGEKLKSHQFQQIQWFQGNKSTIVFTYICFVTMRVVIFQIISTKIVGPCTRKLVTFKCNRRLALKALNICQDSQSWKRYVLIQFRSHNYCCSQYGRNYRQHDRHGNIINYIVTTQSGVIHSKLC